MCVCVCVCVCVMKNCLSEFLLDSDQYSIFIYSFFFVLLHTFLHMNISISPSMTDYKY